MQRLNDWIAVHATILFGSMWATYAFFLYGFAPLIWPGSMVTLLYWSNTVQLWSWKTVAHLGSNSPVNAGKVGEALLLPG